MNRAKANTLTRRVQVLALLFAAGAVAAGVIPMTAASGPVVAETPMVAPVKPPAAPVEVNAPALASAIDLIAPPVIKKDPPPGPDPIPQPVVNASWKYLGAIISGSYKRAVVTVDEKQQLVKEGSKVGSEGNVTEVVEIDPAYIKIKDAAGAEQMIDLEAKQKTQLSIAAPTAGAVGVARPERSPGPVRGGLERDKSGLHGLSPEIAGQMAKAVMELREAKGMSDDDRREKLRGMFPNEKFDADAVLSGGGKGGGGKGGK